MAFYNNFEGDNTALKFILDNISKKSLLIDGVTCNGVAEITEAGDKAYYFKRSASSIKTDVIPGTPVVYSAAGITKSEISLNRCIQIGDVMPFVKTANSVDQVNDRIKFVTTDAINAHNKLAIKYLCTFGTDVQDYTDLTDDNAFDKLIDVIENFRLNNKEKGIVPSAVFVSNAAANILLKDARFLKFATTVDERYPNQIATIGLIPVFQADDMDDNQDYDFVVLHWSAFVAPLNIASITQTNAVQLGYTNGVIIGGEVRYGFEIADSALVLVKKNKLSLSKPVVRIEDFEKAVWADVHGATSYVVDDNGTVQDDADIAEYAVTFTTEEKYIAVKALSTDPDHEEAGAFSDKLFYETREAPELDLGTDGETIEITDADGEHAGKVYTVYVDDVASTVTAQGDSFPASDYTDHDAVIKVSGNAFDGTYKVWKESAKSDGVTYHIPRIVSVEVTPGGTVNTFSAAVKYNSAVVEDGATISFGDTRIWAIPEEGYVFERWTDSHDAYVPTNITSNIGIVAHFTQA